LHDVPPDFARKPAMVAFLSTEDSVSKKLVGKLLKASADPRNIDYPVRL